MAYPNQPTAGTRESIERAGDATSSLAQKAGDTAKSVSRDVSDAVVHAADIANNQLTR